MAYCEVTDLLLGNIPVSNVLDPARFVADASDEIDSKIGFRYATPIPDTAPRPVLLLLKRINAHLASGRLIMAAAAAGSQDAVHAYGASLVRDALEALDSISCGMVDLPIAADPDLPTRGAIIPMISNVDPVSQVEAFYDYLAAPASVPLYHNFGG